MAATMSLLARTVEEGRETWTLDNGLIRARVLPAFGARVWTLEDLGRDIQWLWHNPKADLAIPEPGASYDDCWAGGWEELFPNDAVELFDGRHLPDHGEWWSAQWKAEISTDAPERAELRLTLETKSAQALCEKRVSLRSGAKALNISYRIKNQEGSALRFMFKQHLAAAVRPGDRLECGGGTVHPVSQAFSTRFGRDEDLFLCPPAGKDKEFIYVADLKDGWAGVSRPDGGRLRLRFDKKVFPHCWFFMDFGGWRGLYTAVVEPCTNWPKDLATAAAAGRCARLKPGETLETEVELELS